MLQSLGAIAPRHLGNVADRDQPEPSHDVPGRHDDGRRRQRTDADIGAERHPEEDWRTVTMT